jgi:hypothetical protein
MLEAYDTTTPFACRSDKCSLGVLGFSEQGAGVQLGEYLSSLPEVLLCIRSVLEEEAAAQTKQRPPTLEPVAVLRPPGCRLAIGSRRPVEVAGCLGYHGLRGELAVAVACGW